VYHSQVVPPALLALAQARAAVAGDVHHVNPRRQYNLLYPRRGIMMRLSQSYHTRALPADSASWGRLRRKRGARRACRRYRPFRRPASKDWSSSRGSDTIEPGSFTAEVGRRCHHQDRRRHGVEICLSASPGSPSRRVGEDVATLTPHRSGRAGLPLPVLHGRVSLTDVVVDTIPDSPVKKVAEVKRHPSFRSCRFSYPLSFRGQVCETQSSLPCCPPTVLSTWHPSFLDRQPLPC
jgi:hypothetical protein